MLGSIGMRASEVSPKTKRTIEKLYDRKLSKKQTFNARNNLVGFFSLLMEIDKQVNGGNYEQSNRNTN